MKVTRDVKKYAMQCFFSDTGSGVTSLPSASALYSICVLYVENLKDSIKPTSVHSVVEFRPTLLFLFLLMRGFFLLLVNSYTIHKRKKGRQTEQ